MFELIMGASSAPRRRLRHPHLPLHRDRPAPRLHRGSARCHHCPTAEQRLTCLRRPISAAVLFPKKDV
jgi:hypothetical protein